MFELKIKNSRGEMFELTHNPAYYVIDVDGLSYPSTTINTSTAGIVDGTFFNSSRVDMRNLVITIVINDNVEVNRQQLYRIFNLKKPITVYFKNKNRDVSIEGYVETLECDLFSMREQAQISILCPRAYFADMNIIEEEMSKVVSGFEFPFSIAFNNPIPISEIVENPVVTINNRGDAETGFVMEIEFGNYISGFKLINTTTQQFMQFSYMFNDNDTLVIDTRTGHKKCELIRAGVTTNMMMWLTTDSTWLTLDYGDNDFTFTVDAHEDAVKVHFYATPLYGGV